VKGGVRGWEAADAGVERLALSSAAAGGTERLEKDAFPAPPRDARQHLGASSSNDYAALTVKSLRPALPGDAPDDGRGVPVAGAAPRGDRRAAAADAGGPPARGGRSGRPGSSGWSRRRSSPAIPTRTARRTIESVSGLTREKAAAHLARLREKGRLLLVVAGDVEPDAVVGMARAAFGALPGGASRPRPARR